MATERRIQRKQINTLAGIGSLIVVGLYVGSLGIGPEQRVKSVAAQSPLEANRIVDQFTVVKFDATGQLNHRLAADRAEFFSHSSPLHVDDHGKIDFDLSSTTDADTTTDKFVELSFSDKPTTDSVSTVVKLASPVAKLYSDGRAASELTANEAFLEQQNELAHFIGGVRIVDSVNDTLLLSEKILLDMRVKQVLSREAVNIVSPNASTTAQGFQGNLADRRWQLLSEVKSTLIPNTR